MFVLDASVALAWVLPDEQSIRASAALAILQTEAGIVPAHWLVEVLNGLLVAERRNRIVHNDAMTAISTLSKLHIEVIPCSTDSDGATVFSRAHHLALSAYDAAYLDLALARSLPLATLDKRLAEAAAKAGVKILGA